MKLRRMVDLVMRKLDTARDVTEVIVEADETITVKTHHGDTFRITVERLDITPSDPYTIED